MNLYVITPDHTDDTEMYLASSDAEALETAIFVAAHDLVDGWGSPSATVYLVARDLEKVGQSEAKSLLDNPEWWSGSPEGRKKLAKAVAEWEKWLADMESGISPEEFPELEAAPDAETELNGNGPLEPRYFAVRDPINPEVMTYWYLTKPRGKYGRSTLKPWPPTIGKKPKQQNYYRGGSTAREQIQHEIEDDPVTAAGRFAMFHTRCCICGRLLRNERSKRLGVGPECETRVPPSLVQASAEAIARAHGAMENE